MAHPAGAESEPGVDPTDRRFVPGNHGDAEVGPVGLRRRSYEHPVTRRADYRPERLVDDADAVVVLENGDVRIGAQQRAKFAGAGFTDRRAGRILGTGGQDDGSRPAGERTLERGRDEALVVDRDRGRRPAGRGDEVEQRRPARVLHGDPIAWPETRAQHPLDRVQRAEGGGDRAGPHPIAGESGPGRVGERRQARKRSVEGLLVGPPAQHRPEIRQERGIGVSRRAVRHPGRKSGRVRGTPGDRRPLPDPRSPASVGQRDAARAQKAVGGGNRAGTHACRLRELAYRWKMLAGNEEPVADARLDGLASSAAERPAG